MQPFTLQVIEIIRGIPEGRVMTYGQIAAEAGSPRAARQVVRILHAMSEKHSLPWHRVVNARGEIALQDEEARYMQALYLREEGVESDASGRIDLERYRCKDISPSVSCSAPHALTNADLGPDQ